MVEQHNIQQRLTIRTGNEELAFAVGKPNDSGKMDFESYEVNMAISMAANLREAFTTSELLQREYQKVLILIDAPVMMVPIEEFQEDDMETLYHACFTGQEGNIVLSNIVPTLNAVAVFAVNKDFNTVITDHFENVSFMPTGQPVWEYLREKGVGRAEHGEKLFAFFHDQRMEVFCFQQNRFKFFNSYNTQHAHDALYYLLYAWKQLGFKAESDFLYLTGEVTQRNWLVEKLHQYLQHVMTVNDADYYRKI